MSYKKIKKLRKNACNFLHSLLKYYSALKKFEAAAAEGNRTEAESAYKVAVKSVDKAAAKGILHKNNAAHKKSAMTLKLNHIG